MVGKGEDEPLGDARRPKDDAPRPPVRPQVPIEEQGFDPAEIRGHEEALPHEGEVDFETDVEYLHRAIYREAFEPDEGRERVPWWVWATFAIAIFWAGLYLGLYGGTFGTATHVAYSRVQPLVREEVAEASAQLQANPILAGQDLYTRRCQVCHQATGAGVPGVFPPIIGAERVTGPPAGVVLILLHGLTGPITVAGQTYNGAMPAWAKLMSDAEIAAVASFIRQWETNDASPVTPELVSTLRNATADRATPWTNPELEAALQSPEIEDAVQAANTTAPTPGTAP